jgi:PmbA protein
LEEPLPDLSDLCVRAVAAARDGEDVEAYGSAGQRTQVRVRGGEVESLTFADSRGLGVRVIRDQRVGYAYAADPGEDDVDELVRSARESSRFAEADEGNGLPVLVPVEPLSAIYRESQRSVDTTSKVSLAVELERAAVSAHPEVRKVESAGYGDSVSWVAIASTKGGPLSYARTDSWVTVSTLAERNGETQTGFSFSLGREMDDLDWETVAREAALRAGRLLGGIKPRSERMPVVLDPVAAASFLGVLAGALSAESVLKGRSLFAGMVGQEVGATTVTLVDDGRLPAGPAIAPVDDEGVATARTPLIESGVVRGFLHNTYTALRAGERSTGNAGRGGYRTVPGVSPSNFFIEPGEASPEGLLAQAGRGVYVQEVTGLHSGANPISGEFSVGATGLRIEDGDLSGALREMTIASTLLDVLRSVVALGSDLRFPVGSGLGAPTVLIAEMTVGGA